MTTVLFFGRTAELLGRSREIELPAGGLSVGELRKLLAAQNPAAAEALLGPDVRAAVDQAVAGEATRVRPDQVIAFFPVVSGG